MMIAEWLAMAKANAERRGLPDLIPALEGLAQATERLRAADWNDVPDRDTPVDDTAETTPGVVFGERHFENDTRCYFPGHRQ